MAVTYQPQLVCLHAVVRDDNGTVRTQTECGRPAYFDPEEVEKKLFATVHFQLKCPDCRVRVEGQPVSGLTGRPLNL